MIEIKNLSCKFGHIRAVNNILQGGKGRDCGFLGPNGAGKTTTMRMMVDIWSQQRQHHAGWQGHLCRSTWHAAKIGYLPEHNPLYHEMGVVEFWPISQPCAAWINFYQQRLEYVIDKCGLEGVLNQRIGTFPKATTACRFISSYFARSDVLILDEPTSGLDPNQIMEIRELIKELGSEKTVLLSSHIMQEVQAMCDRVIIINKGHIVVDELKENLSLHIDGSQRLILEVKAQQPDLADWLFLYPQTRLLEYSELNEVHKFVIQTTTEEDLRTALTSFAVEKGWAIQSIFNQNYSLEEIFHNLTLHDPAAEATIEDGEIEELEADPIEAKEVEPEGIEAEEPDTDKLENQADEEADQ